MASILQRLRRADPTALSDAMGRAGAMVSAIKPIWAGARLVGRAFTVRAVPGDFCSILVLPELMRRGEVLVMDGAGFTEAALFGESIALELKRRGIAGAVVDGAVRDVAGLRRLRFPVFARAATPRAGSCERVGEVQGPVTCGAVLVRPGDWIVGSEDGVAVVPPGDAAKVLVAAEAIEAKERRLRRGTPFAKAYGIERFVAEKLAAYRARGVATRGRIMG